MTYDGSARRWPVSMSSPSEPGIRAEPIDPAVIRGVVRRVLGGAAPLSVERVAEGVSTYVYRIRRLGDIFYLRLLPEEGASFAPEALVHALLRERGVSAPEVVYCDHRDAALQRSIMVTTEIKGCSVSRSLWTDETRAVLVAAGRDLAIINSLPVEGFGWIKRDSGAVTRLTAEHASYRDCALDHLNDDLAILRVALLTRAESAAIEVILGRHAGWLDNTQARLAHGDFDLTHIYAHGGRYSGIIDFGEIRGADLLYDLGHFTLHDGEMLPRLTLPDLLDGYQQVTPLPLDYEGRLRLASLLIAVKALARRVRRHPGDYRGHRFRASMREDIDALLLT